MSLFEVQTLVLVQAVKDMADALADSDSTISRADITTSASATDLEHLYPGGQRIVTVADMARGPQVLEGYDVRVRGVLVKSARSWRDPTDDELAALDAYKPATRRAVLLQPHGVRKGR